MGLGLVRRGADAGVSSRDAAGGGAVGEGFSSLTLPASSTTVWPPAMPPSASTAIAPRPKPTTSAWRGFMKLAT